MKDKDNDDLVIKSNRLIQEFKYRLSKSEMRVVNFIISNIYSPLYDEEFNTMQFNISDFYTMLEWNDVGGSDYARLKNMLKNLSNNSSDYIQIGEKETIFRWIEKPYFHKHKGIVELKLDDDLKPFLLQASGIIKAKLKYYFEMDSKYSMRLYELMKSWDGCNKKEFELDDFKSQIDAEQKSYNNFGKFHQGVLKPSVEEINRITDIELEYETKTSGKKVTHVIFYIKKKENNKHDNKIELTENPLDEDEMQIQQFGILFDEFSEFTKEQIMALYYAASSHLDIPSMTLGYEEALKYRQMQVMDYISPKLTKIKATPDETKSNTFLRLLNAVENNY